MDKPKEHFLYLDMLRGVAAIAVVLLHWFAGFGYTPFGSGGLAVDLFFMLSGFVIAHSYGDRLLAGFSKKTYLVSRIIRLYPMIILGAVLGVARVIGAGVLKGDPVSSTDLIGQFVKNLLLLPNTGTDLAAMFPLNGPIWSLHFEMLAYLAFCLFLFKVNSKWILAILPVAAIAVFDWASVIFGVGLSASDQSTSIQVYLHGLGRVTLGFGTGVLVYRFRDRLLTAVRYHALVPIVLLTAIFFVPKATMQPLLAVFVICAVFPMIVLGGSRVPVSGRFEGLANALGDLSYPLYAIHVPLLWIVAGMCKFAGIAIGGAEVNNAIFVIPGVVVLSLFVFRCVDRPTRMLLSKSRSAGPIPARITG